MLKCDCNGEKPLIIPHLNKQQFSYKEITDFKVTILLNYYEEKYLTNEFVSIYLLLIENNKKIALYEG